MKNFALFLLWGSLAAAQDSSAVADYFDGDNGQCGVCHSTKTYEAKHNGAFPSLKGLYRKKRLLNGKPVTDANVLGIINNGGRGMPAYKDMIEETDERNILAFLKTI